TEESLRGLIAGASVVAQAPAATPPATRPPVFSRYFGLIRRHPRLSALGLVAGLAASLLLILGLPLNFPSKFPQNPDSGAEAVDNSVAILMPAPGAAWDEPAVPTRPGSL